jgi:hypothetical protein
MLSTVMRCVHAQAVQGDSCVIPAKAGIQQRWKTLDSRFRGNDGEAGAKAGSGNHHPAFQASYCHIQ